MFATRSKWEENRWETKLGSLSGNLPDLDIVRPVYHAVPKSRCLKQPFFLLLFRLRPLLAVCHPVPVAMFVSGLSVSSTGGELVERRYSRLSFWWEHQVPNQSRDRRSMFWNDVCLCVWVRERGWVCLQGHFFIDLAFQMSAPSVVCLMHFSPSCICC